MDARASSAVPGKFASLHDCLHILSSSTLALVLASVCPGSGTGATVEAFLDGALLFTEGMLVDARNFEFAAWIFTSKLPKQKTSTAIPFPNIITPELPL